jgi:homoserine dehydrogenase
MAEEQTASPGLETLDLDFERSTCSFENEGAEIIILKFGSSVLRDERDLPRAVHEIYRWWRRGSQVLAVVSAFGNTTNELLRRAANVCDQPAGAMLATLLATGEAASSALLGLALHRAGIPATVLDPEQAGLRTVGGTLDADLIATDAGHLRAELQTAVVVLPGFVGRGEQGNTTLLGRGGSDLSALFLARQLGGQCVLLKDVDGIYASDPATAATRPVRFAELKYDTAGQLAGKLVQPKAIRFAALQRVPFVVTSIGSAHQTIVGSSADHLALTQLEPAPVRVALLGCGTVGGGVYQALSTLPELFSVTGVGTRHLCRSAGVSRHQRSRGTDRKRVRCGCRTDWRHEAGGQSRHKSSPCR